MALELEHNPNKLQVVHDQVVPASEGSAESPQRSAPPTPPEKDIPKIVVNRRRLSGDSLKAEAGTEPNVDSVYIEEKMTIPRDV